MSTLRGFFEIGIAEALEFEGLYDATVQYEAGDVIGYSTDPSDLNAHPYVAYMAVADPANAGIAPPAAPWARMGQRGTDGTPGAAGIYTVWLFKRSVAQPNPPNSNDGSVSNGVFTLAGTSTWSLTEPSGTDDLYISFVRVTPATNTAVYGFVLKFTAEDGAAGPTPIVEYSDTGTGPSFDTSPQSTSIYIRFNVNGNRTPWMRVKGNEGNQGNSVTLEFSRDDSSWHSTADTANDKYVRFNVGGVTGASFKFVADDGQDIDIQFSADTTDGIDGTWHRLPVVNTAWVRFRRGTDPWMQGVKIRGEDGEDGNDTLEARYSQGPSTTLHTTPQRGDAYIRFRFGNTGPFTPPIRIKGEDGTNAPQVLVQFASQQVASRFGTYVTHDKFMRISTDNGVTWLPSDVGFQVVGDAGTEGTNVSAEFSQDGQTGWHATLQATDYFIRYQVGTGAWSIGVQFRAHALLQEWSDTNNGPWSRTTPNDYARWSTDGGTTWSTPFKIKGEDGSDGDDSLEVQYSLDNISWHTTLAATDQYIRFRVGGTGPWSIGARFGGPTGGFPYVLYQRSANQPTSTPINLRYDYSEATFADRFTNLAHWSVDVPSGTDQLWRLSIFVPPRITSDIVTPTITGVVYSEKGEPGGDGADGKWFRPVFQWATAEPNDPSGISYNIPNGTIDNLSPWHEAIRTTGSTNESLWVALIEVEGSSATTVQKWNGSSNVPGPKGADGDSFTLIYTRSSSTPSVPTGGTYSSTNGYDPPAGWHESIPSGSDPVYAVVVHLSGSNKTNTGITYNSVYRITPIDGKKGDSLKGIWKNSTSPITDTPTGITIDANGTFAVRDNWTTNPTNPPTGQLTYRQLYDVDFGTDPPTLTALGTPTRDGRGDPGERSNQPGDDGRDGRGLRLFFLRTAVDSPPTVPNISYVAQTQSWSGYGQWNPDTPPASPGDGPYIWVIIISFQGDRNGIIAAAGPTRYNPESGTKGESSRPIYLRKATAPVSPQGITINASGVFTNLLSTQSAPNNDTWSATPPSGTHPLYKQDLEIDWEGPTVTTIGTPYIADGQDAPEVQLEYSDNNNGPWSTYSSTNVFARISTDGGTTWTVVRIRGRDGTNAHDVEIQLSVDNSTWATSVANPYFIRFSTDGGTTYGTGHRIRQDGTDGRNGVSYQQYYHANTANSVGSPNIDYDGSSWTAVTSGWSQTVPTTPVGANIFIAEIKYREGTAGETIEGIILAGTVPGSVAPPPSSTAREYTLYYGLIEGTNEVVASRQSLTFSLAPGETYTQNNPIAYPTSTTATQNYFIRFDPSTDLNASSLDVHAQFADITSRLTGSLATRYIIPWATDGVQGHFRISIRRNS